MPHLVSICHQAVINLQFQAYQLDDNHLSLWQIHPNYSEAAIQFLWDNKKKEAAACRELLDGPNPNDKMTVVWIDSGDPHFFYGEIQFLTNEKTRENEKNGAEWRFTCKWSDTVVLICGRIFSRWFSNSAVFVNCVYTRSASANICFFSSIFHLVLMLRA